jgi:hypothetical protein
MRIRLIINDPDSANSTSDEAATPKPTFAPNHIALAPHQNTPPMSACTPVSPDDVESACLQNISPSYRRPPINASATLSNAAVQTCDNSAGHKVRQNNTVE